LHPAGSGRTTKTWDLINGRNGLLIWRDSDVPFVSRSTR
jgi:hypothetical protein